jgi:L-iditol 2-dehydrogenase
MHRVPCGACAACLSGHEPSCPQYLASGLRPGGFAERLVAPASHLEGAVLPLPGAVGDLEATFVEPLACVLRAIESLPSGRGAVVGCGAVGRLLLRALARRGDAVYALDVDPRRLEPALDDAVGAGVEGDLDYAVVTAPDGLGDALALLRPGGTCILFAARPAPTAVPLDLVYRRELTLRGARSATPRSLQAALAAIADSFPVADLVTDVLPLERFAEGLARYRSHAALKVVFTP